MAAARASSRSASSAVMSQLFFWGKSYRNELGTAHTCARQAAARTSLRSSPNMATRTFFVVDSAACSIGTRIELLSGRVLLSETMLLFVSDRKQSLKGRDSVALELGMGPDVRAAADAALQLRLPGDRHLQRGLRLLCTLPVRHKLAHGPTCLTGRKSGPTYSGHDTALPQQFGRAAGSYSAAQLLASASNNQRVLRSQVRLRSRLGQPRRCLLHLRPTLQHKHSRALHDCEVP